MFGSLSSLSVLTRDGTEYSIRLALHPAAADRKAARSMRISFDRRVFILLPTHASPTRRANSHQWPSAGRVRFLIGPAAHHPGWRARSWDGSRGKRLEGG